jgi:hypothetical protein
MYRRTIVEPTTAGLGFRCRGALRWRDRVARGLGGSIRASERKFAPRLAHVSLSLSENLCVRHKGTSKNLDSENMRIYKSMSYKRVRLIFRGF